jgi:hypothetical protein
LPAQKNRLLIDQQTGKIAGLDFNKHDTGETMSQEMQAEDNKTLKQLTLSIAAMAALTVVMIVAANIFF